MNKLISSLFGIGLIFVGLLALAANALFSALGIRLSWWEIWRLWPFLVLALGLLLGFMALVSLRQPGLGALFIPALPMLTVGSLLLFASIFDQWRIWAKAWPFVILSLALGFVLATIASRNAWFGIPAILIGLNGLVLAFCNLTGLWNWWSVLWTVEPLAVGLVLLLVGIKTQSTPTTITGLAFCAFAFSALLGMSMLLTFGGWILRLAGPFVLILLGVGILLLGFIRRPALAQKLD